MTFTILAKIFHKSPQWPRPPGVRLSPVVRLTSASMATRTPPPTSGSAEQLRTARTFGPADTELRNWESPAAAVRRRSSCGTRSERERCHSIDAARTSTPIHTAQLVAVRIKGFISHPTTVLQDLLTLYMFIEFSSPTIVVSCPLYTHIDRRAGTNFPVTFASNRSRISRRSQPNFNRVNCGVHVCNI